MDLLACMNRLQLLRPWGAARDIGPICLIVMRADLPSLGEWIGSKPWLEIARVMLPDFNSQDPSAIAIGNRPAIPLSDLSEIGHIPHLAKLFFNPPPFILTRLCQALLPLGIDSLWLDGPWPPSFGQRAPMPDFYAQNAAVLEDVFHLWAGDADREVYARRVMAILFGDAGWLPVSRHPEYHHPLVHPEKGDVMIDGGVSDMVGAQMGFIHQVGASGRVFGFEPIPWMAEKAADILKVHSNYILHCAGLARKSGEAIFDSLRDSSHISASSAEGDGKIRCKLDSIDEFAERERIFHIDCIKLDIEGAELSALKGAANVIRRDAPKLIICLYHKPEDIFLIPLFIKKLNPQYRLHLAHSSCVFTDTILYAIAPDAK